ncbi:MAG TPA: DNA polymerase III subunit gamma/tau [Desulfomonilaceae bacterium]|nr:DNA polymerase III subunit gamma/tau [Desulfomonilaceae bacterium]
MPSYLVLARKYRPATFSDVVGQDHVIQTLSNSILSGRVAHAFLFCGVRGVGKTTVARILAKALNCTGRSETDANPCNACSSCNEIGSGISVDVQEIDGASNTSVENIREINENIKYPPVSSRYKIIIIDEVHMISINAFNALLKTLEEPPPHAKFMFATTEAHKVPATINSRCQRFNFRTISIREISAGMDRILAQEGITADAEALDLVAREAQGSFRDGLSLLDQVIALSPVHIAVKDVVATLGIAGRDCFGRLIAAVFEREPARALSVVHELFQQGHDPEQFFLDLVKYVRNLSVCKTVPADVRLEGMIEAPPSEIEELDKLAGRTSAEELQNIFSLLIRGESDMKRSANPWIALEMTVLKMAYAPDVVNLSEILRRLDSGALGGGTGTRRHRIKPGTQPAAPEHAVPSPRTSAPSTPELPKVSEKGDERFTITQVTPLPVGTPDEVWSGLKRRVIQSGDTILKSIMDHGTLVTYGPTLVEIGFNKDLYKEQFENRLNAREATRRIFDESFGGAKMKILTLSEETTLHVAKPYAEPQDGETDLNRALRNEALENSIIKSVLKEFQGSSIEEIKILRSKPRQDP